MKEKVRKEFSQNNKKTVRRNDIKGIIKRADPFVLWTIQERNKEGTQTDGTKNKINDDCIESIDYIKKGMSKRTKQLWRLLQETNQRLGE